jgi:prepilin-type processing-associated H-X9-DG protein
MRCSHSSFPRAAFTLSEILVVIGILVVLAAILFPVFARVGWNARTSSCMTNLKQIGFGLKQYSQDYNEHFPKIVNGKKPDRAGHLLTWRRAIAPYLKGTSMWQCPSNSNSNHVNSADGMFQSYDVVDCGPIRRDRFTPESKNQSPATTILVMEENGFNGEVVAPGVRWENDPGYDTWTNILFAGHHVSGRSGHAVFLFVDGHVKTMKPLDTIAGGINMWNLFNGASVTPRALAKLQAAQKNFQ